MVSFSTIAVLLLAPLAFAEGFMPRNLPHSANPTTTLGLFNFLNQGKKALVKSLAGDYDAVAIRARIDSLVADNPVLMLSFTT